MTFGLWCLATFISTQPSLKLYIQSTVKTQTNLAHYFFPNFMGKTSTNVFVCCRVCTKNLISIKVRKLLILASNCTFLGINSLSQRISQMFIVLGMCNFESSMHDAVVKHNQQMIFRVIAGMFRTEILSTQVCHTDKLFS